LNKAVLAVPMCKFPVGDGAILTLILLSKTLFSPWQFNIIF